jgi:hypothetical protein
LPKRRWLRPVHGDEPVAQVFGNLPEAVAFLVGAAAPRQRRTDHPRPLMLAGVCGGSGAEPGRNSAQGRAEGLSEAPADGGIAREALRLMLVPPGWTQRAAAMPPG